MKGERNGPNKPKNRNNSPKTKGGERSRICFGSNDHQEEGPQKKAKYYENKIWEFSGLKIFEF